MLTRSDFLYEQIKSHQDDLVAGAAAHQLLKLARERRKRCRAEARAEVALATAGRSAVGTPVAALAGNLAACGRHVAGSAQ
jgi:hypothetical protein